MPLVAAGSAPASLSALLGKLLTFFLKAGSLTFGSGLVIVPFLEKGLVQQTGWRWTRPRLAPASDDIRSWGDRVVPGGSMLIHDSFSSAGVTLALAATVAFSGEWRYAGRSRSLAEYRREPVRGTARAANIGRQLAQLPWFARNLAIKALGIEVY